MNSRPRRFPSLPILCCAFLTGIAVLMSGCGSGSKTAPPTTRDIEQALKSLYDKPASPGYDGAVTTEVKSVKIGDHRKWHYADGGDATPDTDVWSARVHLLVRTHYRTRNMVFDWDRACVVYRNGLGEWQVTYTGGATKSSTYDEPADRK